MGHEPHKHTTRAATRIAYLSMLNIISQGLTHRREAADAIEIANQVAALANEVIKINRDYLRHKEQSP